MYNQFDYDQEPVDSRTATKTKGFLWSVAANASGYLMTLGGLSLLNTYAPSALPWITDHAHTIVTEAVIGVPGSLAVRLNMPYPSSPLNWSNKGFIQLMGATGAAAVHYAVCNATGHTPSVAETAAVASAGAYVASVAVEQVATGIGKVCCGFFKPSVPANQPNQGEGKALLKGFGYDA